MRRFTIILCLQLMTISISPNSAASVSNTGNSSICLTAECNSTASRVISYMNPDVDPCTDFYGFACGGFLETQVIPNDKTGVGEYFVIRDKVKEDVKNIILEERPSSAPKHTKLPTILYNACINTELTEQLGITPIQSIADSLGGWPVVKGDAWDPNNNWNYTSTIIGFRQRGLDINYIMYFGVEQSISNNTQRNIFVDDSYLSLRRDYLLQGLEEIHVSGYYNLSVDVAVLLGVNREFAEKEMMDALQFEIALANISLSPEARSDSSILINPRTIKEMQTSWPYMNWLEYINALLLPEVQVDENEVVNVFSLKFMDDVGVLLENTPKRTIANYLMWRIYFDSLRYLSKEFVDRRTEYYAIDNGDVAPMPVSESCTEEVNYQLQIAVGSMYVQKHFTNKTKEEASVIIENLKAAFNEILNSDEWIDETTKKEAIKKLEAVTEMIGYPEELIDDEKLEEYYRYLELDQEKHLESILNISKFNFDRSVRDLRLPFDLNDWRELSIPTAVDTFFNQAAIKIELPAGILQGNFYNADRPNYMNYGSIGWLLAHEITHGFDDVGSLLDSTGNPVNWWQNSTRQAFLDRAQCIVEQYSNFTERNIGQKVNGDLTKSENIADNGGIKESYLAYKNLIAKNGPEPQLRDLNYTNEQMFWLSAGQLWCTKLTNEIRKYVMDNDGHAPEEFRVIGSFQNRKEFANDFKCAAGSPMNPTKKCEVW